MHKLDGIIGSNRQLAPPADQHRPPLNILQWEQAVGPRVAARTQPLRIERGVLYVRVATAAWANELSMLTDAILEQLRELGATVDTVRFSVGPMTVTPKTQRAAASPPPPESPALPDSLREVVAKVDSPDLRRAITHAARRNLAAQDAWPAAPSRSRPGRKPVDSEQDRAPESVSPRPSGTRLKKD